MSANPEFERNIKLEFTRARLIGTPAVIAAVLYLIFLMSDHNPSESMAGVALAMFGATAILWGTRLASEAVYSEVRDRTWDWQRMSGIGPWEMTWGKLAGGTAYAWYGGLISLTAFAVCSVDGIGKMMYRAAVFVLAAMLGQSISMLTSMMATVKERRYDKSQAAAFFVAGFLVSLNMLSLSSMNNEMVNWWDIAIPAYAFVITSLAAFVFFAVLGIYRLMRVELQRKNGPSAWLGFTIFTACFAAGFVHPPAGPAGKTFNTINLRFDAAFGVAVSLMYVALLSERRDAVSLRKLVAAFRSGIKDRVVCAVPSWLVSYGVAVFAAAGMFSTFSSRPQSSGFYGPDIDAFGFRMFVLAALLFLVRDVCLAYYFGMSNKPRRADMAYILLLAALYGLAPAIFYGMKAEFLAAVFQPVWTKYAVIGFIAAGIQAGVITYATEVRLRSSEPD